MGLFSSLRKAILSKTSNNQRTKNQQSERTTPISNGQAPASNREIISTPIEINPEPSQRLSPAELESQLDNLASETGQKLDWRHSIVDLMKLVGMDSSFAERKEMALDLGYKQADIDSKGSAEMNVWLHKKVMEKLSEDTDGDLKIS